MRKRLRIIEMIAWRLLAIYMTAVFGITIVMLLDAH
jgi:hypothetical protein